MHVLVTGATGTAGAAAVRRAAADSRVTHVTALAPRPLSVTDPKLTVVEVTDFLDYRPIAALLAGHDAALWCLGTSQNRVGREELHRITVEYAVAGAKALMAANPRIRFCHLSGAGADPTGSSRIGFAQEKGMAENALDALGLAGLWHFRPGYIHPPALVARPLLQDRVMWRLAPLVRRVAPRSMVDADVLGQAMLDVAADRHPKHVLDNSDILAISAA
ncbi:MAG: NAD(P)H-binding protein [Thermoplasmatota archaeon]